MKLNEQVKAQIDVLTERVIKLKTTIRRVDYIMFITGAIALITLLLSNAFSLDITELDIPATLLELESTGLEGHLGSISSMRIETAESVLTGFMSKVFPIVGAVGFVFGIFNFVRGSVGGAIQGIVMSMMMFVAPTFISAFIGSPSGGSTEQRYINDAVMQSVINYDESEPISQDYIGKVSRVDERYVLAQAAILSKADYPSSYFKALAGDLLKESSFTPTENALYSIEMAAYGHPESEAIVERANTLSGYGKVVGATSFVGQMMFVMLFLGGAGLKLLRNSINKRLKSILQMVSSSKDESEVA